MAVARSAFDAVAPDYDALNRRNPILAAMRHRSVATFVEQVPRGAHVLDLGCGPGTDFPALVAAGYRVTAIDPSAGMVDQARWRASRVASASAVEVYPFAMEQLGLLPAGAYDGAYSGFGPFNCVADLEAAARAVAARLRPGAVLVASVIGRLCPWEIACYLWKRDLRRLTVRFARTRVEVPLGDAFVPTRYYTPAEFERPFVAAGFSRVSLRALGVLVPPPYMDAAAARHPALVAALQGVEDRIAHWPGVRACGDHFLITLRRCR